jgi:hypothetical protein
LTKNRRSLLYSSGTDTTINSGDMAGITLAGVKELAKENAAMKKELAELKAKDKERDARDREREARLARLEQFIPAEAKSSSSTAAAYR